MTWRSAPSRMMSQERRLLRSSIPRALIGRRETWSADSLAATPTTASDHPQQSWHRRLQARRLTLTQPHRLPGRRAERRSLTATTSPSARLTSLALCSKSHAFTLSKERLGRPVLARKTRSQRQARSGSPHGTLSSSAFPCLERRSPGASNLGEFNAIYVHPMSSMTIDTGHLSSSASDSPRRQQVWYGWLVPLAAWWRSL